MKTDKIPISNWIFAILIGVVLGLLSMFFLSFLDENNDATVQDQDEVFTKANDIEIHVVTTDEAEWMWKAEHGVLDQYVSNWWKLPEYEEDFNQIQEGNFRFGEVYMPQSWWINMSEEERELRVRLLEDNRKDLYAADLTDAQYDFYCGQYGIGQ